jgi:hypothetical protein
MTDNGVSEIATESKTQVETINQKWKKLIDELPEGFSLEFIPNKVGTIRLKYNGPGFKEFAAKDSTYFSVCSINSLVCENDDEVVDFIKKQVEEVQKSVKAKVK